MSDTDDDIRSAIASYDGWKDIKRVGNLLRGTSPEGIKNLVVPNYVKDLNAIHAIEVKYVTSTRYKYELAVIIEDECGHEINDTDACMFATARQRALAFYNYYIR